jgi:YD repeat-containing protein
VLYPGGLLNELNSTATVNSTGIPAVDTFNAQYLDVLRAGNNVISHHQGLAQPPQADAGTGTVYLTVYLPPAGVLAAQPQFIYNSSSPAASDQGFGWNHTYGRKAVEIDSSTVDVYQPNGQVNRYSSLNVGTGYYTPPTGIPNSMQKVGSTWLETQPDKLAYAYQSTGKLDSVRSHAGQRWSLSYDGGGKVSSIIDPNNQRTTYSYDGSNKLKRVTDVVGRLTTMTVDGSGNLIQLIQPDATRTTLIYDGNHRLTGYNPAGGPRLTLGYQTDGKVVKQQWPLGGRHTLVYSTNTTVLTKQGISTTLSYSGGSLRRITDSLGRMTTYQWSNGYLSNVTSPLVFNGPFGDVPQQWSFSTQLITDGTRRRRDISLPTDDGTTLQIKPSKPSISPSYAGRGIIASLTVTRYFAGPPICTIPLAKSSPR